MSLPATIEIDQRGRTSLGRSAKAGTYRVTTRADGAVVLEPARVLTEAEIAVLSNPELSRTIAAGHAGTLPTAPYSWR